MEHTSVFCGCARALAIERVLWLVETFRNAAVRVVEAPPEGVWDTSESKISLSQNPT